MAISNQLFNAPTPRVYDPSEKIDRSFQRMGEQISGAITRESDRLKQEQEAFGQMYSNLGEIEGELMENYAGINQQMIDSTRDFVKQHYRTGQTSIDPNFQAEYGKRVGRIRAGMANATRNREQLKQAADIIKNDPTITDKATAMSSLMQRYNDPDFLISQNEFNLEDELSRFVNPQKVFEDLYKNIPSDGVFEDTYDDDRGNTRKTEIIFNKVIPRDQPTLPDGRPNVVIPEDFLQDVMSGTYGQRILQQTARMAEERYSDLPNDLAFANALRDGLSSVAGSSFKDRVIETREQKEAKRRDEERRARAEQRQERALGLRENKSVSTPEESDRWDRFSNSFNTGAEEILGDYERPGGNVRNIRWVMRGQDPRGQDLNSDSEVLGSFEEWSKDRDKRVEILERYGISPQRSLGVGRWETAGRGVYEQAKEAHGKAMEEYMREFPNSVRGIYLEEKEGSSDGRANWGGREIPVRSDDDLRKAFRTLENLRRSGQKFVPEASVPEEDDDPFDLMGIFGE